MRSFSKSQLTAKTQASFFYRMYYPQYGLVYRTPNCTLYIAKSSKCAHFWKKSIHIFSVHGKNITWN